MAFINNGRSSRGTGRVSRGTAPATEATPPELNRYQASPEYLAEIEEKVRRKYGPGKGKATTGNEKRSNT